METISKLRVRKLLEKVGYKYTLTNRDRYMVYNGDFKSLQVPMCLSLNLKWNTLTTICILVGADCLPMFKGDINKSFEHLEREI